MVKQKYKIMILRRSIIATISAFLVGIFFTIGGCTSVKPPAPPPQPSNHQPTISYINAPQEVSTGSLSQIRCVAVDEDNDPLSYTWTASGGKISGSGAVIEWTPPDTGSSFTLEVSVSDGKGGGAKKSVTINLAAKPNTPPKVNLTVTKEDKIPIPSIPGTTKPVTIAQWKTAEIKCIAEDPDGDSVSFLWSASTGKIEGQGNTVNYIATVKGDSVVVVTVIDSRGAKTQASVYFFIPCCGEGSFGQSGT